MGVKKIGHSSTFLLRHTLVVLKATKKASNFSDIRRRISIELSGGSERRHFSYNASASSLAALESDRVWKLNKWQFLSLKYAWRLSDERVVWRLGSNDLTPIIEIWSRSSHLGFFQQSCIEIVSYMRGSAHNDMANKSDADRLSPLSRQQRILASDAVQLPDIYCGECRDCWALETVLYDIDSSNVRKHERLDFDSAFTSSLRNGRLPVRKQKRYTMSVE